MNLGERIYQLRTRQALSQEDLADRLDVSRQSISKWETSAATPELDKLMRLCDLFDVSLDYLTGRSAGEATEADIPTPISGAAPSSQLTAQRIIGGILLAVALIGGILLYLFSEPAIALSFMLPLLLCGILCMALRRRAGYFCAWGLFLCFDLVSSSMVSLRLLSFLAVWRILFLVGLLIATFRTYRDTPIRVTRGRMTALLVGWGLWLTVVAGIIILSLLSAASTVQHSGDQTTAIRLNYGALMIINPILSIPLVPLIYFSRQFYKAQKEKKR